MDIHNTEVGHGTLTLESVDATTGVATPVPVPPGDVFTAVSSAPASLAASIALDAAGNQELVVTPLVLQSDATNAGGNVSITVTDSNGDTVASLSGLNVVLNPVVNRIAIGALTFTTQAAPTAPGP